MGYRKEKKSDREPDPILKLRHARLKAIKVTEHDAAEKNGKTYAPKVSIWWEILNDGTRENKHERVRFWDNYSFVKPYEGEGWVIREGTRIGALAAFMAYDFHDGADFFNDDVEIDFTDLEDCEVVASLEPRQFKDETPTGTRTVSTTLQLAERADRVAVPADESDASAVEDDEDYDDMPF